MSLRVLFAALGVVFVIVWATLGFGWAVLLLVGALVGFYVGAAIEGGLDLSALLAPLRRAR